MKKFRTALLSAAAFIASQAIAIDFDHSNVRSDVLFNPTNMQAFAGESFLIVAKGIVDISNQNGGYRVTSDGTIVVTPQANSGAFQYFRDYAEPTNTNPVQGSRKSVLQAWPAHLPGAPYGALVAGFSLNPTPSSSADFPNGFTLINMGGIARAPTTGGYLFLGANEMFGATNDNSGSFEVEIYRLQH